MSFRGGKRKDKSFYVRDAKRQKQAQHQIVPDLRGFLLTCNHREKEAIREAYSILEEFADQRHIQENEMAAATSNDEEKEVTDDEDIEAALTKEKQELSEIKKKNITEKRFQIVGSGVQNLLFMRTTLADPVELVLTILRRLEETKQQRTRFLIRLVPVEKTCKAFDENVAAAAKEVLPKWFAGKGDVSYCILFKSRLNDNFDREDAIRVVGDVVREVNASAKVEFKTPDLVVMVEVMKSYCCLAVLPQYFHFKKYNLIELTKDGGQQLSEGTNAVDKDSVKNEVQVENETVGESSVNVALI